MTHLIRSPNERFTDPVANAPDVDLDELGTSVPVPADSSQLNAVAEAVAGRTFVLEGPPGTGKSQTITNLLAHAMSSGRRVLFVAEKRAALDVVKKRLEAVGLGELSLDLHDKSARPTAVRQQIKEALELRVSHDQGALRTNSQAAESSRRALARYAHRLHDVNAAGLSLYTARSSELAADQEVDPLEVPSELVANGSADTFDAVGTGASYACPRKLTSPGPVTVIHGASSMSRIQTALDANEIHAAAVDFDQVLGRPSKSGTRPRPASRAPIVQRRSLCGRHLRLRRAIRWKASTNCIARRGSLSLPRSRRS